MKTADITEWTCIPCEKCRHNSLREKYCEDCGEDNGYRLFERKVM